MYTVEFSMKYERSNDDVPDIPDPTSEELEQYIAHSDVIPTNPSYMTELDILTEVKYVYPLTFTFTCKTDLSAQEITNLFLEQSLADGEWGAMPGFGSFVYPIGDTMEELGLLSFDKVLVFKHSEQN